MRAGAHGHPRKRLASGLLVISCLVAALSVGAVHYVHALSQLGDTASSNSSLSFEDREIAGGNSIVVDQRAAYEARALIPATDAYRVAVGPNLREKTELTEAYVASWFTYFLMPRRPADDAQWVICYGCDRSTLRGTFETRWQDRKGISIGRVR